jgi:hypothetical protein
MRPIPITPIFSMPDAPMPSPFTIAKAGTIIWRLVETPDLNRPTSACKERVRPSW